MKDIRNQVPILNYLTLLRIQIIHPHVSTLKRPFLPPHISPPLNTLSREKTHIILLRHILHPLPIHFPYCPSYPSPFRMGRVRVPVRSYEAER